MGSKMKRVDESLDKYIEKIRNDLSKQFNRPVSEAEAQRVIASVGFTGIVYINNPRKRYQKKFSPF